MSPLKGKEFFFFFFLQLVVGREIRDNWYVSGEAGEVLYC